MDIQVFITHWLNETNDISLMEDKGQNCPQRKFKLYGCLITQDPDLLPYPRSFWGRCSEWKDGVEIELGQGTLSKMNINSPWYLHYD